MKLLQLISSLDAASGGPVEGLIQQGRQLVQRGHTVHTATLDAPGGTLDARISSDVVIFLGPKLFNYGLTLRLEPWLREHGPQYDIIIVHGMWQHHGYCVSQLARSIGLKYVIFLHGMLDPWFARRYPLKHLKKWLYWPWAEYRVLRDARYVLFTTEEERVLARESFGLYKVREKMVGYGIAGRDPHPPRRGNAFLDRFPELASRRNLLYLSRLHPKKGCDLLIAAFAKLAMRHSDLHLVIAGPDQLGWAAVLKRKAADLGISARVTFTGMLNGDVKWGAYDAAEVFVLPSHQENFGIVVAEALASGVPVLTTRNVNIWREIEASGAGFIENDDQAGIDALVQRWLDLGEDGRERMRKCAIDCFQTQFEVGRVTEKLQAALEEALLPPKRHTFFGRWGVGRLFSSRIPKRTPFLGYLAAVLAVFAVDVAVGPSISLWTLYALPLLLMAWNLGAKSAYWLTGGAAGLMLLCAELLSAPFHNPASMLFTLTSRSMMLMLVVYLVGIIRAREINRISLPKKREEAVVVPQSSRMTKRTQTR